MEICGMENSFAIYGREIVNEKSNIHINEN
jgi:hypothetical protein